ncbi:hypothetical protein BDB00DRAFT_817692 [Zychaea mexicana]|uniref:uncharacterized protein n=1 Tax=Zychaea mexicana TaxID=64656 RepID=UPI0022FE9293|nr:uncharacterized protein BDB00DRAFT_817692 [Zychaea mexicana]KAI9494649.1 hypothetical protein BDB00DRAFT_817692 [Zychaea mexicana]
MKVSTTCTLPPLADLLNPPRKPTTMPLEVHSLLPPVSSPPAYHPYHHHHAPTSAAAYRPSYSQTPLKAKRKRASPSQLSVLNHIFSQTYFPSTELRIELGKQLGMSPRAVQIWFQNKRQSLRTRERQQQQQQVRKPSSASPTSPLHHFHPHPHQQHQQQQQQLHPCYGSPASSTGSTLPPISPPLSPPSWQHQQQHHYHHHSQREQQYHYDSCSSSRPSHIALPPLQLPSTPSQSAYPSPTSIDSIILH